MPEPWSPEQVAQLEQLCLQPLSAGEIARTMGLTRDAVLGKIWRLAMKTPNTPRTYDWTPQRVLQLRRLIEMKASGPIICGELGCTRDVLYRKVKHLKLSLNYNKGVEAPQLNRLRAAFRGNKPKPWTAPLPSYAPDARNVLISDLRPDHCRYIAGEATHEAVYCGAPTVHDSSWCSYHHGRMFDLERSEAKRQESMMRRRVVR